MPLPCGGMIARQRMTRQREITKTTPVVLGSPLFFPFHDILLHRTLLFGDPFYSLSIRAHSHPVARLMNGNRSPVSSPFVLLREAEVSSLVSLLGDRSGLPTITSCSFFFVASSSFLSFFLFFCFSKDIIDMDGSRSKEVGVLLEIDLD